MINLKNKIDIKKLNIKAFNYSEILKKIVNNLEKNIDREILQELAKINHIIGVEHQKRFFLFAKLQKYRKLMGKELPLINKVTKNFNWQNHLINSILYLNLALLLDKKFIEPYYNLGVIFKQINEEEFAMKYFRTILNLTSHKKSIFGKIKDYFNPQNKLENNSNVLDSLKWHKQIEKKNILKANTIWNLASMEKNIKNKKKTYENARNFLNTFGPYEIDYMKFLFKNNFISEYLDNMDNVLNYSHLEPIEFFNTKKINNFFIPWINQVDLDIDFENFFKVKFFCKYSDNIYEEAEKKFLKNDVFFNYGLYIKSSTKDLKIHDLIDRKNDVYFDPNLID